MNRDRDSLRFNHATRTITSGLRKHCLFVELDGQHSGFLRLRVKISRSAADALDRHCRLNGLHTMVVYCDAIDLALGRLVDSLPVPDSPLAQDHDGF